jgi:hypothetical protein
MFPFEFAPKLRTFHPANRETDPGSVRVRFRGDTDKTILMIGAPNVTKSDNRREFAGRINRVET